VPAAHSAGPSLTIGATEDAVRSPLPAVAQAQMSLIALAGFRAVRITQTWTPGEQAVSAVDARTLRNVTAAAALHDIDVYASVLNFGSATTPLTDADQADFAAYAASVVSAAPGIEAVIVGNEPNLNRYWLPQFNDDGSDAAAPAYETLLARTYDAVKAVAPSIEIVGGALSHMGINRPGSGRDTQAPQRFILDMGKAYRATGRTRPIMDAFAFHPYLEHANLPPTYEHYSPRIMTIADYGRLVSLLRRAFDGTGQQGSQIPIVYAEFGVESRIPPMLTSLYSGAEPATTRPVNESVQARYYAKAMQMAACQPTVRTFFVFRLIDEQPLGGWQSGLYYVNGSPKASLPGVEAVARRLEERAPTGCATLLAPRPLVSFFPVRKPTRRLPFLNPISLLADADCTYEVRLAKGSSVVARVRGRALAGVRRRIAVTGQPVRGGTYRITIRVTATDFRARPFTKSIVFRF
jgi:hypothetical protein